MHKGAHVGMKRPKLPRNALELERMKPIPLSKGWGVMIAKQPFVMQPS
jgi:hypothetical protein